MGAPRLPPVKRLVALANDGKLFDTYKDRPDAEKIAVMMRMIGQKQPNDCLHEEHSPAFQSLLLLCSFRSLDLAAARAAFTFAAASRTFQRSLDLRWVTSMMERAPAGTFHDAELRRLLRKMKRCNWDFKQLDGHELTRRIEAVLGIPETANLPVSWVPEPEVERLLDVWIETWTRLLEAALAANGKIDAAMRRRWREARRLIVASPEFSWHRHWMDLDTDEGQSSFREVRQGLGRYPLWVQEFNRDWLAHGRKQEAAWHKLGPVIDWSTSAIPGIAGLSKVRAGPTHDLIHFLRTLRATTPNATWSGQCDRARGRAARRRHSPGADYMARKIGSRGFCRSAAATVA
jgi:hypothetical protein